MYKLYTDKIENFEAKIKIEGASLKKSKARLVVESEDFDLMFKGTIDSSGNVKIPVKRMRGLLDEDTKGNIRLEVIAEDTYFVPWESTFEVESSKTVTVEVKSQQQPVIAESASSAEIISQKQITLSEKQHVVNIVKLLIKEDININNLSIRRNDLNTIIASYTQENPIQQNPAPIIEKVVKVLEKRK